MQARRARPACLCPASVCGCLDPSTNDHRLECPCPCHFDCGHCVYCWSAVGSSIVTIAIPVRVSRPSRLASVLSMSLHTVGGLNGWSVCHHPASIPPDQFPWGQRQWTVWLLPHACFSPTSTGWAPMLPWLVPIGMMVVRQRRFRVVPRARCHPDSVVAPWRWESVCAIGYSLPPVYAS